MAPIQFGLVLPNGPQREMGREPFLSALHKSLDLANNHFNSIWFTDHLQFGSSPRVEAWTTLTYIAALYPHFHFGHAVLCQSFRNPALLARMAATFQYLTGGHFILGIGAGWHEEEYRAYGYPFPSPGVRVQQLEETVQIIKALWHNEKSTVQGKYYQVVDAYCEPKPDPLPPIMIGGSQPRMLRLIARHADWWNVSLTALEPYREQVKECERACAEVGRDPATLRRTWFGGCLCVAHEADLTKKDLTQLKARNALIGTPDQVREQLQAFIDLGVDYFMLNNGDFPDMTTLELLIHEVFPHTNANHN